MAAPGFDNVAVSISDIHPARHVPVRSLACPLDRARWRFIRSTNYSRNYRRFVRSLQFRALPKARRSSYLSRTVCHRPLVRRHFIFRRPIFSLHTRCDDVQRPNHRAAFFSRVRTIARLRSNTRVYTHIRRAFCMHARCLINALRYAAGVIFLKRFAAARVLHQVLLLPLRARDRGWDEKLTPLWSIFMKETRLNKYPRVGMPGQFVQ